MNKDLINKKGRTIPPRWFDLVTFTKGYLDDKHVIYNDFAIADNGWPIRGLQVFDKEGNQVYP